MIVVSDTSPISHLFKINQLHLLEQLFEKVILPEAVWEELLKLETNFQYDLKSLTESPWLERRKVSNQKEVEILKNKLDNGESEAIVLASELFADYLLMDENKGRAIAKTYGLSTIGTMGVLISAKQNGLILSVKPLMEELINNAGAWISESLYKHILAVCDEV